MNLLEAVKTRFFKEIPFALSMPALLWQVFFVLAPIFFIVGMSFVVQGTFSLSNYASLFTVLHLKIIGNSLLLALCTAIVCLLVAYPVAYFLAFKAGVFKNMLLFFLIIPFWGNLLILVYAWFFVLEKNGFLNNFLLSSGLIKQPFSLLNNVPAIVLAMFYCYLPFMVLPIFSILEKLDHTLIEASLDLGATYRQTLFNVIIPLSYSGIRTGFFFVFVVAFGEFVIPLLMGGDKYMFVGNAISHYIFTAFDLTHGAAFTCLSSIFLLLSILLLHWILRRLIKA
jgi:spermidine/putrescine transport system permease protein